MTIALLLATISAALLLQLSIGIGVMVWRARHAAPVMLAAASAEAADPARAWLGWRDFKVLRREAADRAGSQCSFYLSPVDGAPLPPFLPGQFLTFLLPVAGSVTRCYSLSDAPDPARYRVTIKRVLAPEGQTALPPGIASAYFHDQVQEGDILRVKAPAGNFTVHPDPAVPVVLIGGGCGITPLMSMLCWCLATQPGRSVHLFFGLRCGAEHAFKEQLEALAAAHPALSLHVVYSRPGPTDVLGRDYQHVGRVDSDLLRRILPDERRQFYVCGPAAMMASVLPALRAWGVQAQDLHHEAFGAASAQAATPGLVSGTAHEVHFLRSGRTLNWDGQDANLLDFAERHGLVIESGCRAGSCGSCETKIIAGTVGYAQPPEHHLSPGRCLLCISTPETALVLEA